MFSDKLIIVWIVGIVVTGAFLSPVQALVPNKTSVMSAAADMHPLLLLAAGKGKPSGFAKKPSILFQKPVQRRPGTPKAVTGITGPNKPSIPRPWPPAPKPSKPKKPSKADPPPDRPLKPKGPKWKPPGI